MKLTELKIKYKMLAAESKFIRLEERKACKAANFLKWKQKAEAAARKEATWDSLYRHRKDVVRPEARAAYIARAFLVGKAFDQVEKSWYANGYAIYGRNPRSMFDDFWKKVVHNVIRFGDKGDETEIEKKVLAWRDSHPLIVSGNPYGLPLPEFRKHRDANYKRRTKAEWDALNP